MKKGLLIGFFVVFAFAASAGILYWNYGRGIEPVITAPPADITTLIEETRETPTSHSPRTQNVNNIPLTLPTGFHISIFAKDFQKPRVMIEDSLSGGLLVSDMEAGIVYTVSSSEKRALITGLEKPHGLAMRCETTCLLYVAEVEQVRTFIYDGNEAQFDRMVFELPKGGNHFTRTLQFHPKDPTKMLISIGSTCNVCEEKDWRHAKVLIGDIETGELKPFASGLRNAVFMRAHPVTSEVWATEMGRDLLGDDLPPDEINILTEGKHFGWPFCFGKNVPDKDFGVAADACDALAKSFADIPAHSAPLGLAFIPSYGWPKDYQNDLLVAYHGSWNRTVPTGYKIVRMKLSPDDTFEGIEDFITGWLTPKNRALGRPVDILINSKGAMYISDDKAGVIYQIIYQQDTTPDLLACEPTGCGGQICSDHDVVTTCEFKPEYACMKKARCERHDTGACGWTETVESKNCFEKLDTLIRELP